MTRLAAPALAFLLALAGAAACKGGAPAAPAPPGPAATAPGAATGPAGFVTATAAVRREPSDTPRVKVSGKDVSNFVTTLQRGEQVAVLEARDDWTRVRTSDDREGWLRSSTVLQGDGVVPATVLAPADVFDRPDLLAANARRKIDPGTLLLVVRDRQPFSEVNVSGSTNAWVLTDRLATGVREVSVAKLVEKARWLARSNRTDDAKQILALARAQFADVPLVEVLAQELGEAPPPVPGAPAAPAGDAQPQPASNPPP